VRHGLRAATDVTGFGLIGHAVALARESQLTLEIEARLLPLLPEALALAPRFQPRGLQANRRQFEPRVEYRGALDPALAALLFDPQTSGGLLLLTPARVLSALLAELPGAVAIGRSQPPGRAAICVIA